MNTKPIKPKSGAGTISIALLIAICIIMIPSWSFGSDSNGNDVTDKVTFSDVKVEVNALLPDSTWQKGWQTFYENGSIVDYLKDYSLTEGEEVRLYANWSISETAVKELIDAETPLKGGDYFKIPIDSNVFALKSGTEVNIYDNNDSSVVIGKLGRDIQSNSLVITFNDSVDDVSEISGGWIMGNANIVEGSTGEIHTSFADSTITFNVVSKESPTTTSAITKLYKRTYLSEINKTGWQEDEYRRAEYNININMDGYNAKLKGEDPEVKTNVIMKDLLPDNMRYRSVDSSGRTVSPVDFTVQYSIILGENDYDGGKNVNGEMAATTFYSENISNKYQQIDAEGMTVEEFEKKIESTPYSYGIYEEIYFMANLGDIPSSEIMVPLTLDDLSDLLLKNKNFQGIDDSRYINTMTAYNNLYDGETYAPAYMVSVKLRTFFVGEGGEDDVASNTAYLEWGDSQTQNSILNLKFTAFAGGAELGKKHSLTIIKIDGDTQEKLDGVNFKLERYSSESQEYEAYKTMYNDEVEMTSDGSILFTGLSKGEYRIVEAEGLEGYSDEIVFKAADGSISDGTFEITGDENGTIRMTVENFKVKEPEEEPEEEPQEEPKEELEDVTVPAIKGSEVITEYSSGDVLGDEEISDSNSDLLGKEAKTSDIMNLIPILIMTGAIALIILAAAYSARQKNE